MYAPVLAEYSGTDLLAVLEFKSSYMMVDVIFNAYICFSLRFDCVSLF